MTNIRREPDGWVGRPARDGEEHSNYFRFSDGGIRHSLQAARLRRNELLEEFGPRQSRRGPNRTKLVNNTSETVRVSKNKYGRWIATWSEDSKQHFRAFRTKREAFAHRRE